MSGSRIVLHVGRNKNYYSIPKELLCYHSPYFRDASNSTQGKGQKFKLPNDNAEDFDLLIDYITRGTIPGTTPDTKRTIEGNKAAISKCLRFLNITNKYSLGDLSEFLYDLLHKALCDLANHKHRNDIVDMKRIAKSGLRCGVEGTDIESVFELCLAGNRLRTLMAQSALSFCGLKGLKVWDEQTNNVQGFAGEPVDQLVAGFTRQVGIEPFTKRQRSQ